MFFKNVGNNTFIFRRKIVVAEGTKIINMLRESQKIGFYNEMTEVDIPKLSEILLKRISEGSGAQRKLVQELQ